MRTSLVYGHLDADCFYVSAERVRDPYLAGKPVGVLGNQGAAVIAKSYEMRAAGVKTGMPIWEARRACPDGIYIKRDFRWYEVLSRRLLALVQEFSPAVEYYSIDEMFFLAVPSKGLSFQQLAETMRDRVLETLRIPVTVGIGRSKTLAKLISDSSKPFGALALLDRDAEWSLLEKTSVAEISGIAARRAARLAPYGILNCLDLAFAERRLVGDLITAAGEALWWEVNGDPVLPLHTERPPHRMLSRGGSLGGATADPERVYAWLVRNLERLIEELEFYGVWAGALSVSVMHHNGLQQHARQELMSPTNRFDLLLEAARWCFERTWVRGLAASRMHLIASQLRKPGVRQRSLFDQPSETAQAVADVKRRINEKIGRFALRSGATLPLTDVYRDPEQSYDICDVRGKICF